mmetsp:Transcript_7088/g.15449  ORF Transcript_7088/g.15449 Transcript_7088/m.15449 type:complete len:85 (+) Transcript_7088:225-479(+)
MKLKSIRRRREFVMVEGYCQVILGGRLPLKSIATCGTFRLLEFDWRQITVAMKITLVLDLSPRLMISSTLRWWVKTKAWHDYIG